MQMEGSGLLCALKMESKTTSLDLLHLLYDPRAIGRIRPVIGRTQQIPLKRRSADRLFYFCTKPHFAMITSIALTESAS